MKSVTGKHVAYDYDKQEWIEGEPARKLLLQQGLKTLEILCGPNGEHYYASIRTRDNPHDRLSYIQIIRNEMARLDALCVAQGGAS